MVQGKDVPHPCRTIAVLPDVHSSGRWEDPLFCWLQGWRKENVGGEITEIALSDYRYISQFKHHLQLALGYNNR